MLLLLAFGKRPARRQILRNLVSRGWAAVWISLLYQNTWDLLFSSLPRSYRALGFLVCLLLWGTHSALPAKVRHRNVLGLCVFSFLLPLPKEIGSYDNSRLRPGCREKQTIHGPGWRKTALSNLLPTGI